MDGMSRSRQPHAFHGGASFAAIGMDFADLDRRRFIVDADVLDAWYEPAPAVLDEVRRHLPWLLKTSPPTHGEGLRRRIAARHGLDPAQVLVGGGTSSLMYLALPRLVRRGSRVALLDPMYGEYRHIVERVLGASVATCDLLEARRFLISPEAVAGAARGCDLLILVNPNSPTGTFLDRDGLRCLLDLAPRTCRIWIDETYVDFAPTVPTSEPLVLEDSRLIVAKSMSKFFALSGLRIGYLACAPDLAADLEPWNPPWSAGLLAQVAAMRALDAMDYYLARAEETRRLRGLLGAGIAAIEGLVPFEGAANFVLFRTNAVPAAELVARCRAHGVYLRDCDSLSPRFQGRFVRTAVKDETSCERILKALRAAVEPGGAG
ncbi:MAG: threonine-phosphate decarboxylase CobD [Planctomycetota bacterium]